MGSDSHVHWDNFLKLLDERGIRSEMYKEGLLLKCDNQDEEDCLQIEYYVNDDIDISMEDILIFG